jgi:hypothetical protein
MELNDALTQISEIRQQMARGEVFRGYRAATTAFTGVLALAASIIQATWMPDTLAAYLIIWLTAAVISLIVVGVEMAYRTSKSGSVLQREMSLHAVQQFLPCLVAGGLLTFVMVRSVEFELWLLPGLWAILFSMGIFASRRFLPRGTTLVAGYYLLAGLLCIAITSEHWALWPWTMGLEFGIGQLFASAVLWWSLERNHGVTE